MTRIFVKAIMTRIYIGERNARIFISYSRKDVPIVKALFDELFRRKHDPFLDTVNIAGGDDWRETLKKEVGRSDLMVVVVTPHSNESDYVYEEIFEAERRYKRIVPVQFDESTLLPVHLRGRWNAINASNNSEAVLKIENAIRNLPLISIQLPILLTIISLLILGLILGSCIGVYALRIIDPISPISCSLRTSFTSFARIITPNNCKAQLPSDEFIDISGTYDTTITNQSLWIMVYTKGLYWPQDTCQQGGLNTIKKTGGVWYSRFILGEPGLQYDLVLASTVANSNTDIQLQNWAKKNCTTGDYPGIPTVIAS